MGGGGGTSHGSSGTHAVRNNSSISKILNKASMEIIYMLYIKQLFINDDNG